MSGGTGASVTPEKRIPRKKRNTKPPAMYPPKNDPISNKDINRLITEEDPSLPPHLSKYPPEYKQLLNHAHDPNSTEYDRNYSTDNSRS